MDQSTIIAGLGYHLAEANRLFAQLSATVPTEQPVNIYLPIVIGSTPVLISDGAKHLDMRIEPVKAVDPSKPLYVITHIFTTHNGSWEVDSSFYAPPVWAIERFYPFNEAGADRHLFALVLGRDGNPESVKIHYWTPDYTDNDQIIEPKPSGWANMDIGAGSAFNPDVGERGVWAWKPEGLQAETIMGGGLPNRWHVSTFVVWQRI